MYPLKDYACSTATLPTNIRAAAMKCALVDPTMMATQSDFVVTLASQPIDEVYMVLDSLTIQLSGVNITMEGKGNVLKAAWQTFYNFPLTVTFNSIASNFQERLHSFMPAINEDILNCVSNYGLTCDGLRSMVMALDSVYTEMEDSSKSMCAKWIQRTLTMRAGCPTATSIQWIPSYWKSFTNQATYSMFTQSWSAFNASEDYTSLTSSQLAEYIIWSGTLMTEMGSWSLIWALNRSEPIYILHFMDQMNLQLKALPEMPDYDHGALYGLLWVTLSRVNENFPDVCVTSMEHLFMESLTFVLPVMNSTALSLIPREIVCSDFHDICMGLDGIYPVISDPQRNDIVDYKMEFLTNQTNKDGSACFFSNMTSELWMEMYLGPYGGMVSLPEIKKLNPAFKEFDALTALSADQIADAVVGSGILNYSAQNMQMKLYAFLAVLGEFTYEELYAFMFSFQTRCTQAKITRIENVNARDAMMNVMWSQLTPEFPSFNDSQYQFWLTNMQLIFVDISSEQINQMPAISSCSGFQTCATGFSNAYEYMSDDTRQIVTDWLVGNAKTSVNLTQDCSGDNWLVYFAKFGEKLSVDIIMLLDSSFDFSAHLDELSVEQLGSTVMHIENCLTDVDVMNTLLVYVTTGSEAEVLVNVAEFMDAFNVAYESGTTISEEVKYRLLTVSFFTGMFTLDFFEFGLWMSRMQWVISSCDATILDKVPMTCPCDKFYLLLSTLNSHYSEIEAQNLMDITEHVGRYFSQPGPVGVGCSQGMSSTVWMLQMGYFSRNFTYSQMMTFYPDLQPYEIIVSLTPAQIGPMIFYSGTLVSMDLAVLLVGHCKTISVADFYLILEAYTIEQTNQIQMGGQLSMSFEVGTYCLTEFMILLQEELKMYTVEDWTAFFADYMMYFISYMDARSLQLMAPSTCPAVMAIASGLNTSYDTMNADSRLACVNWLVGTTSKPGGCDRGYTQQEWMVIFWMSFGSDAELWQITSSYPGFDTTAALEYIPMNLKVDHIMTSGAKSNASSMLQVLGSMTGADGKISRQDGEQFLAQLNEKMQSDSSFTLTFAVKEVIISTMLENLSVYFATDYDYSYYFSVLFPNYLVAISEQSIASLRTDMSCNAYSTVVSALNSTNADRSENVTRAIGEFMNSCLTYQKTLVGPNEEVCPALYDNSQEFMSVCISGFAEYFSISDLQIFFPNFNKFSAIVLLSENQLAQMFVTDCLTNVIKASQVFLQLQSAPYDGIILFLTEFNWQCAQNNIEVLPNKNIQDLMFETTFNAMLTDEQPEEYEVWFRDRLTLIISSMTAENVASLSTTQTCKSQASLIKGLGENYDRMSDEANEAVATRIKTFMGTQGSACGKDLSSTDWIRTYMGKFISYITIAELKQYYPKIDLASSMEAFSPQMLAEYCVMSGALNSMESLSALMEHVNNTAEAAAFITELNSNAVIELQNSPFAYYILVSLCETISKDYIIFTVVEWELWYSVNFRFIVPFVNADVLNGIPTSIDCPSYAAIVNGLNQGYGVMSVDTQQTVYNFCKRYFDAQRNPTGTICGSATVTSEEWVEVNFANFAGRGVLKDFMNWNKNYEVTGAMFGTLSVRQLADYTIQSTALSEEDQMCFVFAALRNQDITGIYGFLDQFDASAMEMNFTGFPNEAIRDKMFWQCFGVFQPSFPKYTDQDWTMFFTVRMKWLFASCDASAVKSILQSGNCDVQRQLVRALNPEYTTFSTENKQNITDALTESLSKRNGACVRSGEGDADWMSGVLGNFSLFGGIQIIVKLKSDFNALAIAASLSPMQLAGALTSGNNLNNLSSVNMAMQALEGRPADDILQFAEQLNNIATEKGILPITNVAARDSLLTTIINGVSGITSIFTVEDWAGYMLNIKFLLPSLTSAQMSLFPSTVSCETYQVMMPAFEQSSKFMSTESKEAVCQYCIGILSKKAQDTGSACTENTPDGSEWITMNIGFCNEWVTFEQLDTWNPNFDPILNVGAMTPKQRGEFGAKKCLQNPEGMAAMFAASDANQIGLLLDALNMGVKAQGQTMLPDVDVMNGILMDTLGRLRLSLTMASDTSIIDLFSNKLQYCLRNFNAQCFGYLPQTISCQTLESIVSIMGNSSVKHAYPEAMVGYSMSVLQKQQSDSGNACVAPGTTDFDYVKTYFGYCSTSIEKAETLRSLKTDFTGAGCSGILSQAVMASLAIISNSVSNAATFSMVFDAAAFKANPPAYKQFLSTMKSASQQNPSMFSIKAKGTVLATFLSVLGSMFAEMPANEMNDWCTQLDFVWESMNSTMLEYFPMAMSCECYQVFVSKCNAKYPLYNSKQKAAISQYQINYLTAQTESEGSACATGVSNTLDYVQKNMGNFCMGVDGAQFQKCYEDFDLVSYQVACSK